MFSGQSLRLTALGDGIVELCFDRAGEAINKFDVRTINELGAAASELHALAGLRGVLVTSAKAAFIVGADIFEFPALFGRSEAEITSHIGAQNASFTRFADVPAPIVTAINGLALGGGLEQALASDYRVMASSAQIGLPEVTLGLFPGYGGTVRLPRLARASVAIEWISTGRPRNAEAALADGVIDAIAAPDALRATALEWLGRAIASGGWRQLRESRRGPFASEVEAFEQAKVRLGKQATWQPAALAAVELMRSCAELDRDAALKREHAGFARISQTQAAASLVQIFINEQAVKTKGKAYAKQARPIRHVGVLGAGIMGGGIAYSSAVRGVPVRMKDIAPKALEQGTAEARKQLDKQVQSGRLTQDKATAVLSSIQPQLDFGGFGELDLVIEAVVENLTVKKQVLRELEPLVRADALIASNTSSLSIAAMAEVLARPENFAGMHFFNPVPVMPLVEVIRGPRTSPVAAASAAGYASAIGKTPIVVKDCPGFLVNRVLTAYLLGHIFVLRDGADFIGVDRVLEAFGWPMGPAYLQDVIGMDTMLHVVEVITAGYPQRMHLDFPIAPKVLVEQRRLGQKNGAGFYRYESDPKGKPKKIADPAVADLIAGLQPKGTRAFSDLEITERLMLPMILEAATCLEEGVAESAGEIDLAMVLGLGFPRHAGGPLKYADWLGLPHVVERCEAYAQLGPMYSPSAYLRDLARRGGGFYKT